MILTIGSTASKRCPEAFARLLVSGFVILNMIACRQIRVEHSAFFVEPASVSTQATYWRLIPGSGRDMMEGAYCTRMLCHASIRVTCAMPIVRRLMASRDSLRSPSTRTKDLIAYLSTRTHLRDPQGFW